MIDNVSLKEALNKYSDSDLRSIAEVTQDDGFMYDLRDQYATTAYAFFENKHLGYIFSDEEGIEYHYCLEDGKIYAYDESANPCMLPEGKTYSELYKAVFGEQECPSEYSSVEEASKEIFHKHEFLVTYSGYKYDILDVKRKINSNSLHAMASKLGLSFYIKGDMDKVNVNISRTDIEPLAGNLGKEINVVNRELFDDTYDGGYDNYLACNVISYLYFNVFPNANKELVFDLAKYISGLYEDYKLEGLDPSVYGPMNVIDKLYKKGGYPLFISLVKDSTGKKAIKAIGKELLDGAKDAASRVFAYVKESDTKFDQASNTKKDDHDWSVDGIAKLSRRIKMNNRKGFHKANKINRDTENFYSINEPNPDIDLDRDGEVEAEERSKQIHTADLIPNSDKVKSMSKTMNNGGAPTIGKGGGSSAPNANNGSKIENSILASDFEKDEFLEYATNGNSYIMLGEAVNPNKRYNKMLYNNLYADRMRKTSQIMGLYSDIKEQVPWIKYTYTNPARYKFNLWIDTWFYNESFFNNNSYDREKTVDLYAEMLKRLVNDPRFTALGYNKQTVFIPVLGWQSSVIDQESPAKDYIDYRRNMNPISIIYRLLRVKPAILKDIFGDRDVVFLGTANYFKINFSKEHKGDIKLKFAQLITKIYNNKDNLIGEPDPEDEPVGDSTKAITIDIMDKLSTNQNIKFDSMVPGAKALVGVNPIGLKATSTDEERFSNNGDPIAIRTNSELKAYAKKEEPIPTEEDKKKAAVTSQKDKDKISAEKEKDELVADIVAAASKSTTSDEAIDKMENERVAKLIASVAADDNDVVKINKARAARMDKVRDDFYKKSINGRSVREMITEPDQEKVDISNQIPEKRLDINSINEEWNHLTYTNFDKEYDVNSDIIKILNSMADWAYPVVIRDLKIEDTSTALDYVDTWTVQCEDSFGKRFTLKFDVPKFMNENRYMMLRGNRKTIETQFFLMPILKTDEGDAQIVSNYNKIFIRRYNTTPGKSNTYTDSIVRALKKYKGSKIKVFYGDNTKVCSKYSLPIDYIDLAKQYTKIDVGNMIFYFNQDEIREKYEVKEENGIPYAVSKNDKDPKKWSVVYNNSAYSISEAVFNELMSTDKEFNDIANSLPKRTKYTYSRARMLNSDIPLIVLCGYYEGLTKVLGKAGVEFTLSEKISNDAKNSTSSDYVKFEDGYLRWTCEDQATSLLMNGLKECNTQDYKLADINSKSMFTDFVTQFCERIKTDGLDNFYDCMIDPITKEALDHYKLPTDFVECLLYANALLADNDFIKHTDTRSRRIRRAELVAGYVYKAITDSYAAYSQAVKHTRTGAVMSMKQSAVIDRILLDPTEKDYSTNNMLTDVESVNAISTKGLTGLNSERSYSLDKRTYDESMLNIVGMSTGFAANVGMTRQATLDMNVEGKRGYVKPIDGDSTQLNDVKTLTATEALTPMGITHDDPFRTAMTFIQKSKHGMRCEDADPLLITNGTDEALPYIASDIFAFKAKNKGKVVEIVPDQYMIVEYTGGQKDYVNLENTVQKNSDGGFHVPLKLDTDFRVGQSFKEGDILAYDKLSVGNTLGEDDKIAYKVGTMAKVALLTTDEGFEDSAIMSRRLANAMACDVIKVKEVVLPKNTNIYNVLPAGTHIEEGDQLMAFQTPYDSEDLEILQRNLAGDEEELSSLGRVPIKAETTGTLVAVNIYRTCELDELSPSLKKLVTAYEKPIKAKKKHLEDNGIATFELPPTYKLPATGKLKNCEDGVLIEFCQQYRDVPAIGDKIVWYSANKGVNKQLFPEGEEPYTDMRPNEVIDGFITNTSVNGRMVCSIAAVGSLNKLMVELDRKCKGMLGIRYDDSKI